MANKILKQSGLFRQNPWEYIKIHQIMLQDKQRTMCYKKAIENNLKRDAIVIDLGCGTGILSFFAATKGCRKIYAIDKSSIIYDALETSRKNNMHERIKFVKVDIKKFKPMAKIDMLIHDQIGVYIWNEDVVSKVAYIRDNYLNKDAVIIPSKIDIYIVPIYYQSELEKSIAFWSKKQYGIDFTNLSRKMFIQGHRQAIRPSIIYLKDTKMFLCKERLSYSIDLMKERCLPSEIAASFRLRKNAIVSGVCAFFNIHFDQNTRLSTRPSKNNSHWGQVFLPCIEPKKILRDSVLDFTLLPALKPEEWKFTFAIQ